MKLMHYRTIIIYTSTFPKGVNMKESQHSTTIEKVFKEEKFWRFRAFCKRKGIKEITELTDKLIEEHSNRKGVSPTIKKLIKERLNQILGLDNVRDERVEDFHPANLIEQSNLPDNAIEKIFADNIFNTFREFCKKNKIDTVNELTDKHLSDYSRMNGVGEKKVELVKQKVDQYISGNQEEIVESDEIQIQGADASDKNTTSEKIIDVFSENIFRSLRRYCEKNHIQIVSEISEKNLDEYGRLPGVGIARMKEVKKRINEHLSLKIEINESKAEELIDQVELKKIITIFKENKFNLFKEFCARNNIKLLGEITNKRLEEFASFKGVGPQKVMEVKTKLIQYIKTDKSPALFESGEIYDLIKEKELNELLFLYSFENYYSTKYKLEDIEGIDLYELADELNPDHLLELSKRLNKQKLPAEIISKLETKFTERDFKIIHFRYELGQSLEEVGKHIGVTRERVRQIAKGFLKKTSVHLKRERFSTIVCLLAQSKSYITKQEFIQIVGSRYEWLFNMLKQENLIFKYYKKMDIFFFDKEKKLDFSVIEAFIKELPDLFDLHEYLLPFEEVFEKMGVVNPSIELIQGFLESEKYTKYGEVYSRGKLTNVEVLTYLFKHFIKGPLRIDEEGVATLKKLASQHLDFELSGNVRSIDVRCRDAESLMLVDWSTFKYFDSEDFDTAIITDIEDFLNNEFLSKDILNMEDVFEKFEEKLRKVEVFNKVHLYSLLKYFLSEKYVIGQGNTLNIYKDEKSVRSLEERLIEFMKKKGGICSKEQLLEVIKPQYRVDIAISQSRKIITWGNSQVILVEKLNLTKAEENRLKEYFLKYFQNGFTTASLMYKEMMSERVSVLLEYKGIDEYSKLASLVKALLPNVKGSQNYLYLQGYEYDSFEKVILAKFAGITGKERIKEFVRKYEYSERSEREILRNLLYQGILIEIDEDLLYPSNKLRLSDATKAKIKAFAEEEMGSEPYLSLNNLKEYESKLPLIGFPWNSYLLKTVLLRCGFRQVKKVISNYLYDKIILVREESPFNTLEDLILYLLDKEYKGDHHEKEIYDFLVGKGILRKQDVTYKKVLPFEIKRTLKIT
jgi:molybdopterin converting factor small subunit